MAWLHRNMCIVHDADQQLRGQLAIYGVRGRGVQQLPGAGDAQQLLRQQCRTVHLDKRAPAEVLRLFKDPDDLLKVALNIIGS